MLQGPTGPAWVFLDGNVAPALLALAVVVWGAWRRRWAVLLAAGIAVAITDPFTSRVLKPRFDRPRPCEALVLDAIPRCRPARSMPSTHAANTAALAAATGSPALAGVALVVGVSRVVTGQHWPSDVGAGWFVGAVVGGTVRLGVRAATRRRERDGGSGPAAR